MTLIKQLIGNIIKIKIFTSVLMGKRYIFLICLIGQINMALHAPIKFMKENTNLVISYVLIVRELKKIIDVFIIIINGKNNKKLIEIYFQMKQQEKFMGSVK